MTSGQWDVSPPSPSVLRDHPRHPDAIPGAAAPSRRCGVTERQDASTLAAVCPTASRQLHPRVSVRTTTQREISTPPLSKPLLDGHRACHDAPPEARFARTAVHSVALSAMPSHVARTVRYACKLPPPLPIKGGAVPWPRGMTTDSTHPHAFCLHHDIGICLNQRTSGTWRPGLLSRLACSPLCKHYGVTQYSAPSTPLLDVRPRPEPG
jgi:hypothetical protein